MAAFHLGLDPGIVHMGSLEKEPLFKLHAHCEYHRSSCAFVLPKSLFIIVMLLMTLCG